MKDDILNELLQICLDNKGIDVCYVDVSSVNPLTNYYIILTVSSNRQALAIAKYCDEALSKHNINVKHIEGNSTSEWVLVDGGNYIISLFVNEARFKYSIEKLWSNLEIYKVG